MQDANEMRVFITGKRDAVGSKILRRSVEKFATRHFSGQLTVFNHQSTVNSIRQ
jgi:hypothetical protein